MTTTRSRRRAATCKPKQHVAAAAAAAAMSSTMKLRNSSSSSSSSSFPTLLFSALTVLLLFLASSSFVPIFLFRLRPTTFGWALFTVSSTTLLSSLVGFYSQLLSSICFAAHVAVAVASGVGQALGFLSLFLQPDYSLRLLGSPRSPREQRLLLRVEQGMLVAMFVVQSAALASACLVQRRWAREYAEVEAEREKSARKRSRRMARVQEESMANAAAMAEAKARELDEKMRKSGQFAAVKSDMEV